MGINWNNVIHNQMHGMDAASAFYKEEERLRRERAEDYKKHVEEQRKQREQRKRTQKGKAMTDDD